MSAPVKSRILFRSLQLLSSPHAISRLQHELILPLANTELLPTKLLLAVIWLWNKQPLHLGSNHWNIHIETACKWKWSHYHSSDKRQAQPTHTANLVQFETNKWNQHYSFDRGSCLAPPGIAAQNRTNHDIGGKFDLISKPDLSIYSKWQCFCQCGTKVHTIANHILTGIRRVQRFLTPKLCGRDKTQHLHVCGGISISASLFSSPKGSSSIWVISTIGPFSTEGQKTKTQAQQNKGNNKTCSFLCAFFWEYKIHATSVCMTSWIHWVAVYSIHSSRPWLNNVEHLVRRCQKWKVLCTSKPNLETQTLTQIFHLSRPVPTCWTSTLHAVAV